MLSNSPCQLDFLWNPLSKYGKLGMLYPPPDFFTVTPTPNQLSFYLFLGEDLMGFN